MMPHGRTRAVLRKLFLLNPEGAYAGEYEVDEDCLVEFDDFVRALPESGLADGATIYLSPNQATAIHGRRLSLVAVSLGPLGPEEVQWARAVLHVAEEALSAPAPEPAPPPADLERREADLREREAALRREEAALRRSSRDAQAKLEQDLRSLWTQLAALQAERDAERLAHEAQVARLKATMRARTEEDEALMERIARQHRLLEERGRELKEREARLKEWGAQLAKERESFRSERGAAHREPQAQDPTKAEALLTP